MSEIKEAFKIVSNLNDEIYEFTRNDDFQGLQISSNGYEFIIKFCDECIYSSADDEREYIEGTDDEYEPLEIFLKRKIMEYVENISKIRFIETRILYGIGIQHNPNEFGMTDGPNPDLGYLLEKIPSGEGDICLLQLSGESDEILYRWKNDLWESEDGSIRHRPAGIQKSPDFDDDDIPF